MNAEQDSPHPSIGIYLSVAHSRLFTKETKRHL